MDVVEANGARIPLVGLGTWDLRGKTCVRMVDQALRLGYRHVDTAEMYGNESEVGEGLRASGVKRGEVFVTTKVWPSHFAPRDLEKAAKDSLAKLRLSEVDLLLLHWPNPNIPLADTLGALCKVKRAGLSRHIGVSNFTVALLNEAVRLADEPIVCNQVEVHPFLDQTKVIAACRAHGMAVVAYSPIARGGAKNDKVLTRIGKSSQQDRRAGVPALPSAARHRRHPAHQQGGAANGKLRDIRLRTVTVRDGGDRRARASRRPGDRLLVFRVAELGLRG